MIDIPPDHRVAHRFRLGHSAYASDGVLTVSTATHLGGAAQRAVWVPPDTDHAVATHWARPSAAFTSAPT